jgi:hypothetical protein
MFLGGRLDACEVDRPCRSSPVSDDAIDGPLSPGCRELGRAEDLHTRHRLDRRGAVTPAHMDAGTRAPTASTTRCSPTGARDCATARQSERIFDAGPLANHWVVPGPADIDRRPRDQGDDDNRTGCRSLGLRSRYADGSGSSLSARLATALTPTVTALAQMDAQTRRERAMFGAPDRYT